MSDDEHVIPIHDLQEAESIAEVQSHVVRVNAELERQREPPREGYDTAGVGFDIDQDRLASSLEEWLDQLRDKMSQLVDDEAVESYSVSVSGGMSGISVQLSVTYSTR